MSLYLLYIEGAKLNIVDYATLDLQDIVAYLNDIAA
jgi:hypothetical protein